MADSRGRPDVDPIKDDPVIDLLMKEYAILQDKIDKIGGFRFMIKGWALTLNTGTLVVSAATSLSPWRAISLTFILLACLWVLEYRQDKLSVLFQDRALRIENSIGNRLQRLGLRRIDFVTLRRIPGIANELRSPTHHRNTEDGSSLSSGRNRGRSRFMSSRAVLALRRSSVRRLFTRSDFFFYFLLLVISMFFILSQHRDLFHSPREDEFRGHFLRTSRSIKHSTLNM